MTRSVWKGPFVDVYLLKKADAVRESGRNDVIKTWSRGSTIMPEFVGLTFGVYNGHKFIPVYVIQMDVFFFCHFCLIYFCRIFITQ